MFWAAMLALMVTTTACSSSEDDPQVADEWTDKGLTPTREPGKQDAKTIVETFERNGIKLHLLDITERFSAASYWGETVPVAHIGLEDLPEGIRPIAQGRGRDGIITKVFRMEHQGETYYDIYNMFQSTLYNIFNDKGERHDFGSSSYEDFMRAAKGVCCILVLTTENVKSAEGAPNLLTGIWQNDWHHVKSDPYGDTYVDLYPELPFSITEVMQLNDDFTGYLRTVKTYKDGHSEVALDPFRYELTDYHSSESYGTHSYSYKCHFEVGDVIEYQRTYNYNAQTLEYLGGTGYFPWFKQTEDKFVSLPVNAGQKYGLPARDGNSPIVGRWTGGEYSEALMTFISSTWVFRSDNTGYMLLDGTYTYPFAYTVGYSGNKAELTIYKYNTGFMMEEGFAKDWSSTFDPTILPQGKTYEATLGHNSLELDGWGKFSREE